MKKKSKAYREEIKLNVNDSRGRLLNMLIFCRLPSSTSSVRRQIVSASSTRGTDGQTGSRLLASPPQVSRELKLD